MALLNLTLVKWSHIKLDACGELSICARLLDIILFEWCRHKVISGGTKLLLHEDRDRCSTSQRRNGMMRIITVDILWLNAGQFSRKQSVSRGCIGTAHAMQVEPAILGIRQRPTHFFAPLINPHDKNAYGLILFYPVVYPLQPVIIPAQQDAVQIKPFQACLVPVVPLSE